MSNRSLCVLLAVGAPFLALRPAAASDRDCTGYGSLKDRPAIGSGRITGGGARTSFLKNEADDRSCPAAAAACLRKAFLVPGNGVLVSGRAGGFACATFVNGRGVETDGWVPEAAVTMDAPPPEPTPRDWAGTWIREEAKITIAADKPGAVTIHGDATFGAGDPQRVKRGAVNIGEIAGTVTPARDRLSFAMGDDDRTLPVGKADEGACQVWMQRAGDYLLVDDNNACGGMNVSFRGTYVRR